MLKFFTTYCLTIVASLTFGQTADTFKISGAIISANTSKPIPEGIIMVTRTKGFKSDSLGRFVVYNLSQGEHKLSFSALGYDNKDTIVIVANKNIENLTWTIYSDCWKYNRETALKDIQINNPTILLQGGVAPIVFITDKDFERKYKVSFYDFGCVVFDKQECLIAYNRTIFEYLDKTFGKKWRKEIRKDAIGLKK
jgi:hypothetical protein